MEVTWRRGSRFKQLLDDLKEKWGYCSLKEEALDRAVWRSRSASGCGPDVRQTTIEYIVLVLMFLCGRLEWSLLTLVLSLSGIDLLLNVNRPVGLCGGHRSLIYLVSYWTNASKILLSLTVILSLIRVPFFSFFVYLSTAFMCKASGISPSTCKLCMRLQCK